MYAIWLTFSENDKKYLKKIITNIAKKYDAPEFEPHITIYGLIDIEIKLIKKIIKKNVFINFVINILYHFLLYPHYEPYFRKIQLL